MVRGDFTIREGIVKWIKLRRGRGVKYLYLSLWIVNNIGGGVGRLKAGLGPDADHPRHPGVSVAVLSRQARAGLQQLLVTRRALLLTAVTCLRNTFIIDKAISKSHQVPSLPQQNPN